MSWNQTLFCRLNEENLTVPNKSFIHFDNCTNGFISY